MRWIKNSDGQPDAVLTMTFLAFLAALGKLIISGVSVTIGGSVYSAGTIDAGIIAALLPPLLAAYVARRYTDVRYDAVQSLGSGPTAQVTQATKTEVKVP